MLVTPTGRHKKRMVVDYSRTINKFTLLDAYPLPRIDNIVNDLANYNIFSTFDLKSAYYLIPIAEDDKPYTAFEADGKLYQFCRVLFVLTNAVASFQRIMNDMAEKYYLLDTYPYLDNITVAGRTQEEHDLNLSKLYMMMIEEILL